MNRDKQYYRQMRRKHIRRKKRIVNAVCYNWRYPYDGMYSKNKVHCSCCMCRDKDCFGRHILTLQERRSNDSMKQQMEDVDLG